MLCSMLACQNKPCHGIIQFFFSRIERSLRDHIMTLRKNFITRWNRHCTRILQSMLPVLETRAFSLKDLHSELIEIKASYKVVCFLINV